MLMGHFLKDNADYARCEIFPVWGISVLFYNLAVAKVKAKEAVLVSRWWHHNATHWLHFCFSWGFFPRSVDPTRLLLTFNVSVSLGDKYHKNTALHWAVLAGNTTVISLLLDAGANVDAQNIKVSLSTPCWPRTGFSAVSALSYCHLNICFFCFIFFLFLNCYFTV